MCPVDKLMIRAIAESGGFGKFLGSNKKGISVYKDVMPDNSVVVTALKNGDFSKQVTQVQVNENVADEWVPHVKEGVHTLVQNYETGVTTEIKNLKVNYLVPFKEFNAKFKSGVRNEFSVQRSIRTADKNRAPVGDEFVRISSDNFVHETKVHHQPDNGSLKISVSKNGIDSNYILDQFVVANKYKLEDGTVLDGRTAIRKTHYEIDGKSFDDEENLMKKHLSSWTNV